jgi:hypothetical protein
VRALERDGFGRVATDEEQRGGHGSSILTVLIGSLKRDPFEAGVVCYLLFVFRDAATLKLPAAGDIVDIVECFAVKSQNQRHKKLSFPGA